MSSVWEDAGEYDASIECHSASEGLVYTISFVYVTSEGTALHDCPARTGARNVRYYSLCIQYVVVQRVSHIVRGLCKLVHELSVLSRGTGPSCFVSVKCSRLSSPAAAKGMPLRWFCQFYETFCLLIIVLWLMQND